MTYKKIRATQTVGNKFIKGHTYEILNKSYRAYNFKDEHGDDCSIYDKACYGEYAIIIPEELNINIKVL